MKQGLLFPVLLVSLGVACGSARTSSTPRASALPGTSASASSGAASGGSPPTGDPASAIPAGGMDGAGQLRIGINPDLDVYPQPIWQDGQLSIQIINQRGEDVDVAIYDACATGTPCVSELTNTATDACPVGSSCLLDRARLAGPWHVPAQTWRSFHGEEVTALALRTQLISYQLGDGTHLGVVYPPAPPERAATLAVVSNQNMHSVGFSGLLVETDFVSAPGSTFRVRVTTSKAGQLRFWARRPASSGPTTADVTAVRSDRGVSTDVGDVVEVEVPDALLAPSESPAELPDGGSAGADAARVDVSDPALTRTEVDLSVPDSARGAVSFDAWFCGYSPAQSKDCGGAGIFGRIIPIGP